MNQLVVLLMPDRIAQVTHTMKMLERSLPEILIQNFKNREFKTVYTLIQRRIKSQLPCTVYIVQCART